MISQLKITSLLFAAVIFLIVGCSDDSVTGTDQPEPPAVPEAIPAKINSDIFDNNNPTGDDFDPFNEASINVWIAATQLNAATFLSQTFLESTRSTESEFEDGTWTWTFSSNQEMIEASVLISAEELQDGYKWDVFVSGTLDGETTVNEFSILSGFISKDGSSGNWQTFSPEYGEQAILEYNWEVIDESSSSFSAIFPLASNEDGDPERFDYVKDGAENTLEYDGFNSATKVTIYWNSETGTGYIDREGEDRRCWDASFAETACS